MLERCGARIMGCAASVEQSTKSRELSLRHSRVSPDSQQQQEYFQASEQLRSSAYAIAEQMLAANQGIKFHERYIRISLISCGASARVLSAYHAVTDERVAVKAISKAGKDRTDNEPIEWGNSGPSKGEPPYQDKKRYDKLRKRVLNEIAAMKQVEEHPNAIQIKEVYEDERSFYLVIGFCSGGELFEHIYGCKDGFTERQAAMLMQSLLLFLAHCHSKGVVHCDVKPENIVFDSEGTNGVLKVVDFGLSEFCQPNEMQAGVFGTVRYSSPEMAADWCGQKTDIWSAGVVMYQLLCGRPPFSKKNDKELLDYIRRKPKVSFPGKRWAMISQAAKDCIRQLLDPDYKSRPTAEEALMLPWVRDSTAAPDTRLSAEIITYLNTFADFSLIRRLLLGLVAKNLSGQEANKLVTRFLTLDQDRSGKIDYEELSIAVRKVIPDLSDAELQRMFEALDLDSTGTVELPEFCAALLHMVDPDKRRLIAQQSFKSLDRSGTGYLSKAALREVLAMAQSSSSLPSQPSQKLDNELDKEFAAMDVNGDGKISMEEFTAVVA